jgi:hypothetical protein
VLSIRVVITAIGAPPASIGLGQLCEDWKPHPAWMGYDRRPACQPMGAAGCLHAAAIEAHHP